MDVPNDLSDITKSLCVFVSDRFLYFIFDYCIERWNIKTGEVVKSNESRESNHLL